MKYNCRQTGSFFMWLPRTKKNIAQLKINDEGLK
jgi:hypothetical protein